jgi:DnaJ-class molecular chaperone
MKIVKKPFNCNLPVTTLKEADAYSERVKHLTQRCSCCQGLGVLLNNRAVECPYCNGTGRAEVDNSGEE